MKSNKKVYENIKQYSLFVTQPTNPYVTHFTP